MRILKTTAIIFIVLIAQILFVGFSFASVTDGTVDAADKYAWSENAGWINFGTAQGNVHIVDAALTGYAWGENIGWISLNCSNDNSCGVVNYKVANDGEGNLSGYAWSENSGWVSFNPAGGGVTINASGEFLGYAWGENIGWVVFNCATTGSCGAVDYKVKTDWRPQSARPVCNNSFDDDGDGKTDYPNDPGCSSSEDTNETDPVVSGGGSGGGGMPAAWYNPPGAPAGGFSVLINNNAEYTDVLAVTLDLRGGSEAARMSISNFADFHDSGQEPYQTTKNWIFTGGEGVKIVYVKFYASWGQPSEVVSDAIIYQEEKTIIEKIKEIPKKIIEEVKKIPEIIKPLVPEFLKPKTPEVKPPEVPIEELVPKEAPLVFQGKWQLLPREPIREFVLAPLPKAIRDLAQKFPTLGKTFEETGIAKITDVAKLKTVKLTLPGLTERVGLPTTKVAPGKFALPQDIPVANLSPSAKQQLPTEIVFTKTGGELIDFNIALSVTEKGEAEQKITTISGKPLNLVVKPEKPVNSIKGYIIFKAKKTEPSSFQLPLNSLLASMFFADPVFAKQQEQPVRIEEKLVLLEFEYTDPDGDGIYTADIQAPLVEGEYEIITVMDYEDPDLGQKEIRLITVVDPEGYIYERAGEKETRIPGAIISLFWLNSETKQYELWPAKEYQQENPQITNATGKYSFLVPEGSYYLKVETPGYLMYDGKPFQVQEGSGIHMNIELKTKYWWLKVIDWKIIVVVLFGILLLYNFYRDKIREKLTRKS